MKISFKQKGDFSKLTSYLLNTKKSVHLENIDRFGKAGVEVLASATPVDSGVTAASWYYKIIKQQGKVIIRFFNSNIQNGVPIAIILQYGHATRNGGWVEGRDYINPAIQPIFDKIAKEAWEEVVKK